MAAGSGSGYETSMEVFHWLIVAVSNPISISGHWNWTFMQHAVLGCHRRPH